MKAFVINLDARVERWSSAREQCRSAGFDPVRFAALDESAGRRRFPDISLTGGEVGLNATFDRVLDHVQREAGEWVLVVEDDVRFVRASPPLIQLLSATPPEVDMVRFGFLTGSEWRSDKSVATNLKRIAHLRARYRFVREHRYRKVFLEIPSRFNAGSHALAIRPSRSAELRELLEPFDLPLDHLVHRAMQLGKRAVMQTSRSYATQRAFKSDIERSTSR